MVGFILIVVLVVVAMMVFLVLSIKNNQDTKQEESLEATNMLNSILTYTTSCAIVFEPQYETTEELIKSAYQGKKCSNKNKEARIYLEETLKDILTELLKGEATVQGAKITILERDETGEQGITTPIETGSCTNSKRTQAAQRNIITQGKKLIIRLELCKLD